MSFSTVLLTRTRLGHLGHLTSLHRLTWLHFRSGQLLVQSATSRQASTLINPTPDDTTPAATTHLSIHSVTLRAPTTAAHTSLCFTSATPTATAASFSSPSTSSRFSIIKKAESARHSTSDRYVDDVINVNWSGRSWRIGGTGRRHWGGRISAGTSSQKE